MRPNAQWCSLCYVDLRVPAPKPESAPKSESESESTVLARLGASAAARTTAATDGTVTPAPSPRSGEVSVATAGWPCTSCSAVVPLNLDACPDCGAAFLARLADDGGRHRSSSTGSLSRLPRSARLVAGVLAGLLIALLVPLLLALFG